MSGFDRLRKGPNMIQMAPEARFGSMIGVVIFWASAIGLLHFTGLQFGIPVLELMFGWIWDALINLI